MITVHDSMARRGLVRPRQGRIIAGVCAGLARRFGVEALTARFIVVQMLVLIPGSLFVVYPVLWLLMPGEERVPSARPA